MRSVATTSNFFSRTCAIALVETSEAGSISFLRTIAIELTMPYIALMYIVAVGDCSLSAHVAYEPRNSSVGWTTTYSGLRLGFTRVTGTVLKPPSSSALSPQPSES